MSKFKGLTPVRYGSMRLLGGNRFVCRRSYLTPDALLAIPSCSQYLLQCLLASHTALVLRLRFLHSITYMTTTSSSRTTSQVGTASLIISPTPLQLTGMFVFMSLLRNQKTLEEHICRRIRCTDHVIEPTRPFLPRHSQVSS